MKWFYLISWILFLVFMGISSDLHEKRLVTGTSKDRRGFWEMLWYGGACIAFSDFFDSIMAS